MLTYKDDWEEAKKHYEAYWAKDYMSRCCLAITMPRKTPKKKSVPHLGRAVSGSLFVFGSGVRDQTAEAL